MTSRLRDRSDEKGGKAEVQQVHTASAYSKNLARSGNIERAKKGDKCYVPSMISMFEEATVKEVDSGGVTVVTKTDDTLKLPMKEVFLGEDLGPEGVNDMVSLRFLHEPSLIANLEKRFKARKIYTYVGSILVSVNPYKNIPIYTPSITRMYSGQPQGSLPPHVYAVADSAFNAVKTEHRDQSILISGESGAGKTEAVKLILGFLTAVSGTNAELTEKIKVTPQERILSTNPILEAFGNAKTIRNNNSSRFAKLIDIQFDSNNYIIGGKVTSYLLEKSRVVKQTKNERNFHVFYYLLAGCDKTERAVWGLYDAKQYRYVNQTRVYEIKDVNSKLEYVNLKRAMTTGGISVHEQHLTFTLMSAVLHLGNVRIHEVDDEARVKNMEVVKWVAHLLKCDVQLLNDALLFKQTDVGDEVVQIPLSGQKAKDTRDTLAKELYERNFKWLVSKLNTDMESDSGLTRNTISLLDIFGFEHYEMNFFEQFCINYANERLQHEFNQHIFQYEKSLYLKEQIDVSDFKFSDNTAALDLIEKAPAGLMLVLDEETRSSTGTDQSFLVKVLTNPLLPEKSRRQKDEGRFIIIHYAGEVQYSSTGFVETNRENFSPGLLTALRSSRIPHFVSLFDDSKSDEDDIGALRLSLAGQFRQQLISLMHLLGRAGLQYVRCIKPNEQQSGSIFDRVDVLRQMRATGILDTVRIRKDGYPYQRGHQDLLVRYEMLCPADLKLAGVTDVKGKIAALMKRLGFDDKAYQIGLTKVFLKDEVFHKLEGERAGYYNSAATTMQAALRGFVMRKKYKRRRKSAMVLQYWVRKYLAAVDVSEEVGQELQAMKGLDKSAKLRAVEKLGNFASRSSNVESIVDQGGVDTILGAMEDEKAEEDMLQAGTRTLGAMAQRSEHSRAIARTGVLNSMVDNIHKKGDNKNVESASIDLVGVLANEEKNAGAVVRSGAVNALTGVMEKNSQGDVDDVQASKAVEALGNLSKSKRVAKMFGRDQKAIKTVIDGINQKPKFARLTEYSVGILANLAQNKNNLDMIVDLGGIETLIKAMKFHGRNEKVLKEVARAVEAIATNPMYAKMLGEQGAVRLAMESLAADPELCGPPALSIVKSLHSHPANARKLIKGGGVDTLLGILGSNVSNEKVLTTVMLMLSELVKDPNVAVQCVKSDGPRIILEAMQKHTTFVEFNLHGLQTIYHIVDMDRDSLDVFKQGDAVSVIAHAMEFHAMEDKVLEAGVQTLRLVSDRQDLEKAMDTVARSRMKDQTEKILLDTGHAVVVVSAMELLEDNVEYVVTEGGIPILLSIVNGTSLNVKDKIANDVLAPAVRGLARLLINDNNIDEFIAEAGVQSLVAAIGGQSDKERVSMACVQCASKLISSGLGYAELAKLGGVEALLSILKEHKEFERVTIELLRLLLVIGQSKESGVRLLLQKNALEAIQVALQYHQNRPRVLALCAELLRVLCGSKSANRQALNRCVELMLSGMKENTDDAALAMDGLRFLTRLTRQPESISFLQEKKASTVVLMVLDSHYGNLELIALATKILAQITGTPELLEAIKELRVQSGVLVVEPKRLDVMERMLLPVTLISCMASNVRAAKVVVEKKGFQAMSAALAATEKAKNSAVQERLLKHLALALTRLAAHKDHIPTMLESGVLKQLLSTCVAHVDYEELVEETQHTLDVLSRSPNAITYLVEIRADLSVAGLVQSHPLNDNILIAATRFVTRLAKGADVKQLADVRKEGVTLAFIAIDRFMNQEDPLTDSLGSVARLAALTHDETYVMVGSGGIDMLAKVLQKHQNSPTVMTAAVAACSGLAEERSFAKEFVEKTLFTFVVEGMETYCDNEEYCSKALSLLSKLCLTEENIDAMKELDIAGLVMETMARHTTSEPVQSQGIAVLKAMSLFPVIGKVLTETGAIRMVFNGVRSHPLAPGIVMDGIGFADNLAQEMENHATLVAERAKEMIAWAMRAYPKNIKLQTLCRKTLNALVLDAVEREALIGDSEVAGDGSELAKMPSAKGLERKDKQRQLDTLIVLMKTIKSTKSKPESVAAALHALATSKAPQDVLDEMIQHGGLARLVTLVDQECDNLTLLLPALKCMTKFADKGEHINVIVAYGGIGALIRSLQKHLDKPDVLAPGIKLLGKLSVFNRLKVLIGLHGGVPVILAMMEKYLALAPLLNKCGYTLGNLAANCLPNRRAITKGGGVNLISFAMQKHRSYLELVINSARALSPLCADDDQARLEVAKGGGSLVIVRSILHHPHNPGLLQNGLNCLHKISQRSECLPTLIHQGAVQAVIAAMKAYPNNVELQQFALEILANLSAHKSRETQAQLTRGGTVPQVIKTAILHHKSSKIQIAAYQTMNNIASGSTVDATAITVSGFVPRILQSISKKQAKEQLLLDGIQLLSTLSGNEDNAHNIVEAGAPQVIVLVMRHHAMHREIMQRCLVCLSKLSTNKDHAKVLAQDGVVMAIVEALLGRMDDDRFITDVLRVLVNLAILEDNAITISETAVDPLIQSVETHFGSHGYLRMFYMLMSNLSLWPRASRHLIEHGMIPIVVNTMKETSAYPALLVKMMKVLTNFCLVGESAKRLLHQGGALQCVKQMMLKHKTHIQLTKAGEVFVFKLSGTVIKEDEEVAVNDLPAYVNTHVSEHLRNLLTSGVIVQIWDDDGSEKKTLKFSLDFKDLLWYDIKKARMKESIPLKFIKDIQPGACTPALKMKRTFSRNPEITRSCGMFDSRDAKWTLSVECNSDNEMQEWVLAVQTLKRAYQAFAVGLGAQR